MTLLDQLQQFLLAEGEPELDRSPIADSPPLGTVLDYSGIRAFNFEDYGEGLALMAQGLGRTCRLVYFRDAEISFKIPGPLLLIETFHQTFAKPTDIKADDMPDYVVVYRPPNMPEDPTSLESLIRIFLLLKAKFHDRVLLAAITGGKLSSLLGQVTEQPFDRLTNMGGQLGFVGAKWGEA